MALLQLLASGMFYVELQGAASFPRETAARCDRAISMQRNVYGRFVQVDAERSAHEGRSGESQL